MPSRTRAALAETGSIARLSAPLVASLVVSTGTTVVDSFMLGPLGAIPLAAVSLTQSVIIVFYSALYGFAGPIGLFAGRAHGAGTPEEIGRIGRHGAILGLAGGIVGALAMAALLPLLGFLGQPPEVLAAIGPYWLWMSALLVPFTLLLVAKGLLDSADRAWTGVALSSSTLLLNILFNWALIYGNLGMPALGLTGAGLASFLATALGCAIYWAYVRFAPATREWWGAWEWRRAAFTEQTREGGPMMVQYLLEGGAVAVAGVMIGWFGAVALAGNQIALAVGATAYMLPLGVSAAVTIRVAQAIGAEEATRVGAIGAAGLGIVTLWMGLFAIVFLVAGEAIARLFVEDPAIVAAAAGIFVVFGFTQLFDGIQSVSLGALRGLLDNQWPTRVSLIAYWLVSLPLSWLFGFAMGFGAVGVWAGFGTGILIAAVALSLRFRRMARRASASA